MNFTDFSKTLREAFVAILPPFMLRDPDWEGVPMKLVELFYAIKVSLELIGYSEVRMKSTTRGEAFIEIFATSTSIYGEELVGERICQISMIRKAEVRIFDKLAEGVVLKNLVDYARANQSVLNVQKTGEAELRLYLVT